MSNLQSRPYKPNSEMCCEACVFGRGQHADFCTGVISNDYDREFTASVRETLEAYDRTLADPGASWWQRIRERYAL